MGTIARSHVCVEQVIPIELPTPFPVGPVNVYVILAEKLTLVDTGLNWGDSWRILNHSLEEHGFSIRDIEQIVLTHHHLDHMGMLNRILQVNPVPVYGHPNARTWLRQEPEFVQWQDEFFRSFFREMGVPDELANEHQTYHKRMEQYAGKADLTHSVQEGDTIPGMPGWTVVDTRGHAQSHIALFRERDGLLVAGDHIIGHISSNALIEPPLEPGAERAKPLLLYRENLRKCAALPVTRVLSGHGDEVENLPTLVNHRLLKMDERADNIKKILARGAVTAFDVVQALFPDKYRKQVGLAVSEVVGHLDLLLARGEIVAEKKGEFLMYRPV